MSFMPTWRTSPSSTGNLVREDGGGITGGECGLSLSLQDYETIKREAPAVALSVFRDQEVPDWFYATYQKSDGSIDLAKLWADINSYLP